MRPIVTSICDPLFARLRLIEVSNRANLEVENTLAKDKNGPR